MSTKPKVSVAQSPQGGRRRGFTIRELAVSLACLLVAAGLLASLAGANRDLSKASVCASNLETLFGGLMAYVNTYNSFPPHNPYPQWVSSGYVTKNGITDTSGIDPSIGWIMTYGLAVTPPDTYINDPMAKSPHFKWYVLDQYNLPSVCVCPAANYNLLFTANPEIDPNNSESFVYQYAAFYQCSGTCRSATVTLSSFPFHSEGDRNSPVPDPSTSYSGQIADNCRGAVPNVWVCAKAGNPTDPSLYGYERERWIQAIRPSEVDSPSRVYYMADSRDYRPEPGSYLSAAISDGWHSGYGNLVFLGTRHYSYANVMYLDGQVSRDYQSHPIAQWNMDYDSVTKQARSSQWRCATFADSLSLANIGTQHHIMPQLNIKGWERFFSSNGVAAK